MQMIVLMSGGLRVFGWAHMVLPFLLILGLSVNASWFLFDLSKLFLFVQDGLSDAEVKVISTGGTKEGD